MKICYILASRSRKEKFFASLNMLRKFSNSSDYFVLAKLDTDDPEMNTIEVKTKISNYPEVTVKWGLSKSKINAINRDNQEAQDADIIVCLSDDQVFTGAGFDDVIRDHMPEDLDAFLHFPDSFAKDRVCIMTIIGRTYFNRFGYIYHEDYYSMFCDDEATRVAKILGKYHFINKNILDHNHYSNRRAVKDELYKRNDTYRQDEKIFERRKQINFGL